LHRLDEFTLELLDRLLELRESLILLRELGFEARDERLEHAAGSARHVAARIRRDALHFARALLRLLRQARLRHLVPRALLLVLHRQHLDRVFALLQQRHQLIVRLARELTGAELVGVALAALAVLGGVAHGRNLASVLLEEQIVELLDRLTILRLLLQRVRAQIRHGCLRARQRLVLLRHELLQPRDGGLRHRRHLRDGGFITGGGDAASSFVRRRLRVESALVRVAFLLRVLRGQSRVRNLSLHLRRLRLRLGGAKFERANRLNLLQHHALRLRRRAPRGDADGGGGANRRQRLRVGAATRRRHGRDGRHTSVVVALLSSHGRRRGSRLERLALRDAQLALELVNLRVRRVLLSHHRLFNLAQVRLAVRCDGLEVRRVNARPGRRARGSRRREFRLEELFAQSSNLAEFRVGVVVVQETLERAKLLELRLRQLGAIGGVANRRVRLLKERLATFRALLEFGERALPLLGVRDVDATGERGFHAGQRRVLRLRERPGIFPEAEQPPILHLQTAVQTQTIRVQTIRLRLRHLHVVPELRLASLESHHLLVGARKRGGSVASSFHLANARAKLRQLSRARRVPGALLRQLRLRLRRAVLGANDLRAKPRNLILGVLQRVHLRAMLLLRDARRQLGEVRALRLLRLVQRLLRLRELLLEPGDGALEIRLGLLQTHRLALRELRGALGGVEVRARLR